MTTRTFAFAAVALAALAVAAGRALPQDAPTADAEPDEQEMLRRWTAAATPGKHHEALGVFVGSWDVKMWVRGGGSFDESQGKAEYRWRFEDRWLEQTLTASVRGRPYRGFGLLGYDNFKRKYVTSWVDDQGTAMANHAGNFTAEGNVILSHGLADDPMTGRHDRAVRYVTRIVSVDEHVFEIHDLTRHAKDTKMLELRYTRATPDDDEKQGRPDKKHE